MTLASPLDDASIDPQVRSFFRAIKENPDDDTPRLIFADWLQERGDASNAARGEYLRLCVLRHRLSPDDPTYSVLKRREGELFTEHCWNWLGPLVDAAKAWTFQRGMIQIEAQAGKLTNPEIRAWALTPAGLWVDGLALSGVGRGHIMDLGCSPLLAYVNRLDLSDNSTHTELLFRAFRARGLRFLKILYLARCRLLQHRIEALAHCRDLTCLRFLDLQRNRLNDAAARLLAESPHLQNLATLRLGRNRFTAEGVALLRQAFGERVHF